jgi:ubiquinol oxidase
VSRFIESANSWSVDLIKGVLVLFFGTRNYAKFYALETIARVPYFAYVSVLHLKESCGYRRQNKDLVKLHFSEVLSTNH